MHQMERGVATSLGAKSRYTSHGAPLGAKSRYIHQMERGVATSLGAKSRYTSHGANNRYINWSEESLYIACE